jgi:hypothetical protein
MTDLAPISRVTTFFAKLFLLPLLNTLSSCFFFRLSLSSLLLLLLLFLLAIVGGMVEKEGKEALLCAVWQNALLVCQTAGQFCLLDRMFLSQCYTLFDFECVLVLCFVKCACYALFCRFCRSKLSLRARASADHKRRPGSPLPIYVCSRLAYRPVF